MKLKHLKKENGQAMVEFALILPILIIIIGAIIDFGWIFQHQVIANNACREGARYASIHHGESGYDVISKNKVKGYFLNFNEITEPKDIVSVLEKDTVLDGVAMNDTVSVSLTYYLKILTPILSLIIDNDNDGKYKIEAQTSMKME